MRDLITLERLDDAATPKVWNVMVADLPAAAEPQSDGRIQFRIWYREDLHTKADLEPAVRVLYRGRYYDVIDPVETVRRTEVRLDCEARVVDEIGDLETGARRVGVPGA